MKIYGKIYGLGLEIGLQKVVLDSRDSVALETWFEKDIRADIRTDIRADIRADIRTDVRADIRADVRADIYTGRCTDRYAETDMRKKKKKLENK